MMRSIGGVEEKLRGRKEVAFILCEVEFDVVMSRSALWWSPLYFMLC